MKKEQVESYQKSTALVALGSFVTLMTEATINNSYPEGFIAMGVWGATIVVYNILEAQKP